MKTENCFLCKEPLGQRFYLEWRELVGHPKVCSRCVLVALTKSFYSDYHHHGPKGKLPVLEIPEWIEQFKGEK